MTIEDPDGLSGKGMRAYLHVVHASHLALFDEPYIELQEITLHGIEKIAKPVRVLAWHSKQCHRVDN